MEQRQNKLSEQYQFVFTIFQNEGVIQHFLPHSVATHYQDLSGDRVLISRIHTLIARTKYNIYNFFDNPYCVAKWYKDLASTFSQFLNIQPCTIDLFGLLEQYIEDVMRIMVTTVDTAVRYEYVRPVHIQILQRACNNHDLVLVNELVKKFIILISNNELQRWNKHTGWNLMRPLVHGYFTTEFQDCLEENQSGCWTVREKTLREITALPNVLTFIIMSFGVCYRHRRFDPYPFRK